MESPITQFDIYIRIATVSYTHLPKFKIISDLPWSEQEIKERLTAYKQLSDKVEQEWHTLSAQKKET